MAVWRNGTAGVCGGLLALPDAIRGYAPDRDVLAWVSVSRGDSVRFDQLVVHRRAQLETGEAIDVRSLRPWVLPCRAG